MRPPAWDDVIDEALETQRRYRAHPDIATTILIDVQVEGVGTIHDVIELVCLKEEGYVSFETSSETLYCEYRYPYERLIGIRLRHIQARGESVETEESQA